MSTIQIKHRYTGAVLYEHEPTDEQQASGLAMRAAIEAAFKCNANLRGADLSGANLSDTNLSGANLRGANLSGADLIGIRLWGAAGNNRHVRSLQCGTYAVTYTADRLQIGCQNRAIADWWGFDDRRILEMDGRAALEWWRVWKPILQTIIAAAPAEPTGYVEPEANKD